MQAGDDLARAAIAVLDANWMGHATRPSPRLYPHQWSWDSAFMAMGRALHDPARARQELRSLFRGQWSNGLLPHIVFSEDPGQYFPGADFWQSERSPYAPRTPRTSGIVQPPVHAMAAWHVYQRMPDRAEGLAFLADLLPALTAWHAYLYRERVDEHGLAEIWHPWESGMDNSPLWDDALGRINPAPGEVPHYERADLAFSDTTHRPTDAEYDRYIYLVALMRERAYLPEQIRPDIPFAVHDVLFNAILVRANRDLARIARELGAASDIFETWAERTGIGIETRLWDEEGGLYLDADARTGQRIAVRTGAAFSPLLARIPDEGRAKRVADTLESFAISIADGELLMPSLERSDPRFEPARYWRGPAWPVVQWILQDGLEHYGFHELAARLRAGLTGAVGRSGFWEHYDPTTGDANGGEQFAWTAAIVLDVLRLDNGERHEHGSPTGDALPGAYTDR